MKRIVIVLLLLVLAGGGMAQVPVLKSMGSVNIISRTSNQTKHDVLDVKNVCFDDGSCINGSAIAESVNAIFGNISYTASLIEEDTRWNTSGDAYLHNSSEDILFNESLMNVTVAGLTLGLAVNLSETMSALEGNHSMLEEAVVNVSVLRDNVTDIYENLSDIESRLIVSLWDDQGASLVPGDGEHVNLSDGNLIFSNDNYLNITIGDTFNFYGARRYGDVNPFFRASDKADTSSIRGGQFYFFGANATDGSLEEDWGVFFYRGLDASTRPGCFEFSLYGGGDDIYFLAGSDYHNLHAESFTEHTSLYLFDEDKALTDVIEWVDGGHPDRLSSSTIALPEDRGTDLGLGIKALAKIVLRQEELIMGLEERILELEKTMEAVK